MKNSLAILDGYYKAFEFWDPSRKIKPSSVPSHGQSIFMDPALAIIHEEDELKWGGGEIESGDEDEAWFDALEDIHTRVTTR
jgi:hypothetical protein